MEEDRQIVAVELDGQPYGFRIANVREILQMVEIRPIPDAPAHVSGAINVRGRFIPILDLRMILGLSPAPYDSSTPIVIIEDGTRSVGVIVDDVTDVIAAPEDCFEPPDGSYPTTELLESVCKLDDRMLLLFETRKLLGDEVLPEQVDVVAKE